MCGVGGGGAVCYMPWLSLPLVLSPLPPLEPSPLPQLVLSPSLVLGRGKGGEWGPKWPWCLGNHPLQGITAVLT